MSERPISPTFDKPGWYHHYTNSSLDAEPTVIHTLVPCENPDCRGAHLWVDTVRPIQRMRSSTKELPVEWDPRDDLNAD